MLPVLLVTTRSDDALVEAEVDAVARFSGLPRSAFRHLRGEREPIAPDDADGVAAVIVTGSPYTTTDPQETKSADQVRVETQLGALLDRVIARDVPFLGACYGVSTLGIHQGAIVDRTYGEPAGAARISLTAAGRADPVFGALPASFDAFVGHKEAVRELPPDAVLLASGEASPVQAFRVGGNQYATQFHPELDVAGFVERITLYRDSGYFSPTELDAVIDRARTADVSGAHGLLRAFADRYVR